jgi:hypothetical protein
MGFSEKYGQIRATDCIIYLALPFIGSSIFLLSGCDDHNVPSKASYVRWWAPIASFSLTDVSDYRIADILKEQDIPCTFQGSRGHSVLVPHNEAERAIRALRASKVGVFLKYNEIIGGPRPDAMIHAEQYFTFIGYVDPDRISPSELMSLLNEAGVECGMVRRRELSSLFTLYVLSGYLEQAKYVIRNKYHSNAILLE